jgi:hypothetical protein
MENRIIIRLNPKVYLLLAPFVARDRSKGLAVLPASACRRTRRTRDVGQFDSDWLIRRIPNHLIQAEDTQIKDKASRHGDQGWDARSVIFGLGAAPRAAWTLSTAFRVPAALPERGAVASASEAHGGRDALRSRDSG